MTPVIIPAVTSEHLQGVRELWLDYWNQLGFTPCFQGFADELDSLPGLYAPPDGRLLLVTMDDQSAGAVALRRHDETTAEIKRLYVNPKFRGQKLGELLISRLFAEARAAGYKRLVGDTLPVMGTAIGLYDRLGFKRIDQYTGATDAAIYIEYQL